MYLARISSSSLVHLPFFNPTFSQHGALPILTGFFSVLERRARKQKEITTATARNAASCCVPPLACAVEWAG
jgi:hypothetical protein